MCIFFKRKKKEKGSVHGASGPIHENLQTAREHLSQRKGYEKPLQQHERRHGINDVHRKIRYSGNCSIEEQKHQMAEAQKALGLRPNTALIERIAERNKKFEKTQELSQAKSVMSTKGDIAFSFTKRKLAKDDDTVAPNLKGRSPVCRSPGGEKKSDGGCNTPNPEEELLEEDQVDSEPNSENYMYNGREIVYTCHDMVRSMGKQEMTDVAGELSQNNLNGNVKWDPFGPMKELESRDMFNCAILRRNTLISNTLGMPTEAEKIKYDKKQQKTHEGHHKRKTKVAIKPAVQDLAEFNDLTVVSQTQSVSTKRVPSIRDASMKSKKEKKRAPSPAPEKAQQKSNPNKSKESCKTGGNKSAERPQSKSAFSSKK